MDPLNSFSTYNCDYQSLIELYYKAREGEVYYRSLRHAETRRNNYHKIIDDIESFVSRIALDSEQLDYLQKYFFADSQALILGKEDIILQAKSINQDGFDLLEIGDQLTFDILKEKYRQATLKLHPDIGGSEEKMTILNTARKQFHELLSMKELKQERLITNNSRQYCISLIELLINIYYDIYDIENLNRWIEFLIDNKQDIGLKENFFHFSYEFLLFLCDAFDRIIISNCRENDLKILEYIRTVASEQPNGFPEYMSRRILICENNYKINTKPKIILNHIIQVENAYKYDIINQDKYNTYKNKFNNQNKKNIDKNEELKEYLSLVGFISLPSDKNIYYNFNSKNAVPENYNYYGNLDALSEDQINEYFKTFYSEPTIELIRKYTYIRLDRILRSIIYYFDVEFNFDVYIRELELLNEIQNKRTILPLFINNVLTFIKLLQKQSFEQIQERLEILKSLDKLDIEEKESDGCFTVTRRLTFNKISPNSYVDFAMEDMSVLKQAFKTRTYISKSVFSSDKYNSEEYKSDSIIIKNLQQAEHKIWDLHKKDSVDELEKSLLIEKLLKEMFDIENKITYKEELQIGYWINELTISYVKQKKYEEAFYWLQKFIFLPNQWKLRSNDSELQAIDKRFERCKKALKLV